jgi:hypothetical protein
MLKGRIGYLTLKKKPQTFLTNGDMIFEVHTPKFPSPLAILSSPMIMMTGYPSSSSTSVGFFFKY